MSFLLVSCLFITGCAKKYASVSEYSKEMEKIKQAKSSYMFEGTVEATKKGVEQESAEFKYYYVNGKSKIEFFRDGQGLYQTIYFDGNEVMVHSQDQDMLIVLLTEKMLKAIPEDERTVLFNIMTFGGLLYNWDSPTGTQLNNNQCPLYKARFVKNTKMNGYQCRLISFGEEDNEFYSESCVNDDLGVAVYSKLKAKSQGKNSLVVLNANSIETDTVTISDVEPPSYLEKYTMAELFTKIGKLFSNMGN